MNISFNTNEAQPGDVYKIVIPETGNGLDASGTYRVQAAQYTGDYAHAEWHEDVTNHQWIVTDTFTKNVTSGQTIILTTNQNFDYTSLHSVGTFDRDIYLYKNNVLLKTLHLSERIDRNPSMGWDQYNYDDSIYTMDGNQVLNHVVKPNTDYQWRFNVNSYPNFNHGTTITIPMPEHFQLDSDATRQLSANNDWINLLHAAVTQSGNNVVITLPQLSADQLAATSNVSTTFNIVGKFVMDQPTSNTTLRSSVHPQLTANYGSTTPKTASLSPTVVTIIGQDHGLDKLNEGQIFNGNISPDRTITEHNGTVENVTPLADTSTHDLNKSILLNNLTPYDLNNLKIHLTVPDGMNITGLSINNPHSSFGYHLTMNDGTVVTGNYTWAGAYTDSIKAPTGKTIQQIELDLPKLSAYEQFGTIGLSGTLAKQYKDGSPLKVGQNLHTEFTVTADNLKVPAIFDTNQIIIQDMPKAPEVHQDHLSADSYQNDNQAGTPDAGYIHNTLTDLQDSSEELTYYVVLPTNATIQEITDLPVGTTTSIKRINGHQVLIMHGNFKRSDTGWRINLNNSNLLTSDNLSSPYYVFVVMPSGHSLSDKTLITNSTPELSAYVEGNSNAYELNVGTWDILAATGTYPATQSQGNQDLALTSQGKSDDKGRQNMTFTTDIVDSDSVDLQNVTVITAIPGQYDGKSQFDFHLTGANSVHVANEMTGAAVTSGFTNYYSTEAINLNTAHDDTNLMSHFVTADQVTDWSKIKTVLTKFTKVPANSIYGIHLDGVDPTIGNDPQKTAYASSVVWSNILNPLVITPGSKSSASITISGQSTIHLKLHFQDGSQPDIEIPSLDKTYQDGKDQLKLTDFLTATKNSQFDDATDTSIPKAIRDVIPSDYVLDVQDPTIENATGTFANGMPNDTAKLNQVVSYYFDGDSIVLNLVKKTSYTETVTITRRIQYVDQNGNEVKYRDTDGTLKTYPEVDVPLKQVSFTGKYNPLTGHQDPIDQDQFKKLELGDSDIPSQIGGYMYLGNNSYTKKVDGVQASAIKESVSNLDQQAKHGYEIDVTLLGRLMDPQLSDTIAPHTVNIIQDVKLVYAPSHANLILVGAGLGETNQLLSSSSSVNADGSSNQLISFTDAQGHVINDASLHRDGYTYQIYYYNGTLYGTVGSATGLDSVHYVSRDWLTNPAYSTTSYANLADAFAGKIAGATSTNQAYDSVADYTLDRYNKIDTSVGIAEYSQNFFVVYTPVEQRKQTLYILSDNDPYAKDPFMKDYALPKTTADADKSGTDFFKVQGQTGNNLIHSNDSGMAFNGFSYAGSDNTYSNAMYDSDSEGHQINHHIPHADNATLAGQLGMVPVYERAGYYIPKATYQFTDAAGKTHVVTITNHLDVTKYSPDEGEYSSGDQKLLMLLNYLTTGKNVYGAGQPITLRDDPSQPFTISVDGITNAKIYTNDAQQLFFELPSDQTWVYDDTVYDNSNHQNIDPQPQIIKLTYAALPVNADEAQVHIHYIDVDQVQPMSDTDRQSEADQGISLNPLTNRYSINQVYDSNAREWDPSQNQWTSTGGNGETYNITKADENYDNTSNDDAIIAKLAQQGYVVVQRDVQTRGQHEFDPYSSDYGNGVVDGNSQLPMMSAPVSSKNYYVFLKKAHQVQYQVLVEDADGNVESQPLVDKTQLGIGGTNENVAKTLIDWNKVDWQKDSGKTIGQKYDQIIAALATSQPNYTVVPHDSTDAKLKKTDEIPADATFTGTSPLLYTIYVTHKQGDVHIHYIDVDGQKASGTDGHYVATDGTEIKNTEQDITGKNYGDTYTNTPWDFAAHHYVLAETEPAGATSGTVSAPSADVYVYLKHGTEKDASSRSKTVTETIHYVYKGGKKAHNDNTQTRTFTEEGTKDLVTGQTTYTPASGQSFDEVDSPVIAGYTPDITSVPSTNVNYDSSDIEKTVTYTPDKQKLTVTFIDDTTGKVLQTVAKNGNSGTDAKYNTADDIAKYEGQHYKLVSDSTKGKELFFDNVDKDDQSYKVHLTHATEPSSASETITRTIVDYVPDKTPTTTKQPVTFTRTGTKDLVTDKTTWNDWTPKTNQWNSYTAIGKPGYTPDIATVDAKTVKPTDQNETVEIHYTADSQKLTVTYIDDTTGKTLDIVTKNGDSGTDAKYNTADDIAKYEGQHYQLVSDSTKGKELVFDNDDSVDQSYKVHLTHATKPSSASETITRTIVDRVPDETPTTTKQPVTFTRTGTKDLVTDKTTWNDWTPKTNQWNSYTAIGKPGYTPDTATVDAKTVKPTDQNATVVIRYTGDSQKLTVKYIDDTTGKTLKVVSKTGASDSDSKYNTKQDISDYENQHYQLVSDSTKGKELVFDNDDSVDQSYEVHLTHETKPNSASETITRTIVDHVPGEKPTTTKQSATFKRTGTTDLVTGKTTWNDWTPKNNQWNSYTAIGKPGYTPDKAAVDAKTVKPTDQDTRIDIYYTADAQKLTVKYIDDVTGKVLKTVAKQGPSDSDAKYNTKQDISDYEGHHYELVSDGTNGQELVFDHNDKVDQNYEVHLTHQTKPTTESKTITRTIVDHVPGQDPLTTKQPVTFTRTGTKDLVTGHTNWNNWSSRDPQWQGYTAHGKTGYTPDHAHVAEQAVQPSDSDVRVDIHYTADEQKLTVKYMDDTTGKVLKTITKQGPSDSDAKYNTKQDISDYEGRHYQLVSDSTKGQELVFDHDDSVDQSYEVHLTHATEPSSASETITRTIVDHVPGQKPITTKQPVTFTRTGTKDLVTGKTAWNDWTPKTNQWNSYTAIGKPGYTPDHASVAPKTVQSTDKDTRVDIHYTADEQKLTVKYIDDTTGQTLKMVTKQGPSDSDAGYNTNGDISDYEGQHYNLVSDSTNGQNLNFDHDDAVDQYYEVHLSHQSAPVTDTKTITRTIIDHVPGQDPITTKQPVVFTRTGTKDLVTGHTNWNDWTSSNDQWTDYTAHGEDGYTADPAIVAAQTVRPSDSDVRVDIYYKAVPVVPTTPSTPSGHDHTNGGQHSTPGTNSTPTATNPHGTTTTQSDHEETAQVVESEPQQTTDVAQKATLHATSGKSKTRNANHSQLPQTGSATNQLGLIGLGISLEASLLGLLGLNKRQH